MNLSERNKNILLGVLVVGVIGMTVAFAALTSRIKLNGTANVAETRWNIHFQNWRLDTQNTVTVEGRTQQNTAEYPQVNQLTMSDSSNVTKVEGLNVTLHQPNDYAKYNFEIKNDGTIDGELSHFDRNITCPSGKNCDFLEYTVTCEDAAHNDALAANYVLVKNTKVDCTIELKYKNITNGDLSKAPAAGKVAANVAGSNQVYTQEAISVSIAPTWNWIQSTQTANNNQGGGNTPSNSYATTFDGNYIAYKWQDVATSGYGDAGSIHGNEGWYTSINPESKAYLRTTGSLPEVCGVFGSGQEGTVCMTSSYYNGSYSVDGYYSDFENVNDDYSYITTSSELQSTGLKGYSLAKAEEMLTKGASSCNVFDEGYVYCNTPGKVVQCLIQNIGHVFCEGGNGINVNVNSSGGAA